MAKARISTTTSNNRDPRLLINFEPPAQAKIVNNANPDNITTFKKWSMWNPAKISMVARS